MTASLARRERQRAPLRVGRGVGCKGPPRCASAHVALQQRTLLILTPAGLGQRRHGGTVVRHGVLRDHPAARRLLHDGVLRIR